MFLLMVCWNLGILSLVLDILFCDHYGCGDTFQENVKQMSTSIMYFFSYYGCRDPFQKDVKRMSTSVSNFFETDLDIHFILFCFFYETDVEICFRKM